MNDEHLPQGKAQFAISPPPMKEGASRWLKARKRKCERVAGERRIEEKNSQFTKQNLKKSIHFQFTENSPSVNSGGHFGERLSKCPAYW